MGGANWDAATAGWHSHRGSAQTQQTSVMNKVDNKTSMHLPTRVVRNVVFVGAAYLAIGMVFGTLAGEAASNQIRVLWRLAGWAISAAVFAGHIGYEHVRLRCSAGSTAFHTSLSVALGAFALAIIAIGHSSGKSGHSFLAFLIWPLLIWIPAFLIALAAASMLTGTRRNS